MLGVASSCQLDKPLGEWQRRMLAFRLGYVRTTVLALAALHNVSRLTKDKRKVRYIAWLATNDVEPSLLLRFMAPPLLRRS